jgi:hypothetical protein
MIIDPVEVANELYQLLIAKQPNGGYVVKKQHRDTVMKAEILLRKLFK